ncbi:hypothetical protein [Microbacterium sp. NPDC076911]|uniref:hypothetical protein n=1 Tax=Microbacterium sp. NPDC076911 TaxID=3154958 RepID=UPI00343F3A31
MSPPSETELILRGFAFDLAGSQRALEFARPVGPRDGVDYVVRPASGFAEPELTPLRQRDRRFVRWLTNDEVVKIRVDEGAWIIGDKLLRDLRSLGPNREIVTEITANWATLPLVTTGESTDERANSRPDEFWYRLGTHDDYFALMNEHAEVLQAALYQTIYRRAQGIASPIGRTFRVYRAFSIMRTRVRALDSVVYSVEIGDDDLVSLESNAAESDGFAETPDEIIALANEIRSAVKRDGDSAQLRRAIRAEEHDDSPE